MPKTTVNRLTTQERREIGDSFITRESAIEALRELGVWGSFKGIEIEKIERVKFDKKDRSEVYDITWVGPSKTIQALTKEYFDILGEEG